MSSVLSSVCLTEDLADVYFRFPNDIRIPAHKTLLSLRSPVFKAMFYGTLPLVDAEVVIDDIDNSTFKLFLRFVYTDQVTLDKDNVIYLMNAANKYQVTSLLSRCGTYLEKNLRTANVCTIYRHARFFCFNDLIQKSQRYIETNAIKVFRDDDFLSLSIDDLKEILKSEKLNINEVDVFRFVLRWTDNTLKERKRAISNKSRRELLLKDNILYLIAIPMLSMEDYTTVVLPTSILTDEEHLQVFNAITVRGTYKPATKFDASPRNIKRTIIRLSINDLLQQWIDHKLSYTPYLTERIEIRSSRKTILQSVTIRPAFQDRGLFIMHCFDLHWSIRMHEDFPSNCVKIQLGDKGAEVLINELIEYNSAITCTFALVPPQPFGQARQGLESECISENNYRADKRYQVMSIPPMMNSLNLVNSEMERRYMFTEKLSKRTFVLLNISGCHFVECLNFAFKDECS